MLDTYMPRLEPVTTAVLFWMRVLAKLLVWESRGETLAADAARQRALGASVAAMTRDLRYFLRKA